MGGIKYYTASSVKAALERTVRAVDNEKLLRCEMLKELKCPNPDVIFEHGKCCMVPENCPNARSRSCEQVVKIKDNRYRNDVVSLLILRFRFTVSGTNNDGCIDSEDATLQLAIEKGYINKADLVELW